MEQALGQVVTMQPYRIFNYAVTFLTFIFSPVLGTLQFIANVIYHKHLDHQTKQLSIASGYTDQKGNHVKVARKSHRHVWLTDDDDNLVGIVDQSIIFEQQLAGKIIPDA
jgi:hypothetical protein